MPIILSSGIFLQDSSFAQIGLSPLPATQEVLPSYTSIYQLAQYFLDSIHYVPPMISIPAGTAVALFNDYPGQVHTVTSGLPESTNSAQMLNPGFMPFGTFYQMTFNAPGYYSYYCTLHPYMTGSIHVGGASEMGHHFTLTFGAEL